MTDPLLTVAFIVGGFALGALPFSVWIGRYALKKDIRQYGDGNPGMTNVIRAGGLGWGGLAMLADVGKGALPVGAAAHIVGMQGWSLVAVALAPVLGHAFSPLLGFRGGKAIAATGGMWFGLTLGSAFVAAMVLLVYWYFAVTLSGWTVALTTVSLLVYLLLIRAEWVWLAVWLFSSALLLYKHRADLRQPLRLRVSPWFRPLFRHLELS